MGTWTSLVSSTMFDGIKADMLTVVAGVTSMMLIVAGAFMIWRMMR